MIDQDQEVQIEGIEQTAQIGREGIRTATIETETTAKEKAIDKTAETEIEITQIEVETTAAEETIETGRVRNQEGQ